MLLKYLTRNLPDSFYTANISLKENTITKRMEEDKVPFSWRNINARILSKTLANQIQEHINKIIHHDEVDFTPETQGCGSTNQ